MNHPTHEEVAHYAHKIWQDEGYPSGRDTEIWLEAEHLLATELKEHHRGHPAAADSSHPSLGESHSAHALAESASERRKESSAPIVPHKLAPKTRPPETGKPLWSKPHGS
ncbi:MAG TPA: DUF2934 domain-containing protein [Rariglobus sp.]|jgi:hypothetical protein|nr:DUF2934 domain-containing protein [Rariglobus sp.]